MKIRILVFLLAFLSISFPRDGIVRLVWAQTEIYEVPYIDIEATVVSLSLHSALEKFMEGEELKGAPRDSAVVRIDSISDTFHYNWWSSMGIEEGKEVSLDFEYTASPAKIITVIGQTRQIGKVVEHEIVPTKITFEDGYFVFRENGNSMTETILPGLQEGSRFKTRLWYIPGDKAAGKYEIIF